jgi:hypothetical protein
MYTVNLYNRLFEDAPATPLSLKPLRYSAMAIGGCEYAEIAVDGTLLQLWEALRWLRFYVVIHNEYQSPVWWGIVTEATINLGGISIGKTLDGMTNRVAVAYTYNDANGLAVRQTTAWADNTETQARYGIIERLESQGDMETAEALALRDRALDTYGKPIATVNVAGGNGGTLRCRGLWSTLDWKLYNQPGGVVRYEETGNYDHFIGFGFTANTVGFDELEDKIHDLNGRLKPLREDDYIVVSGAANGSNNGTFKVLKRAFNDPQSRTATTISFDATDDILDIASGLGFIDSYQLIQVTGSAVSGNNRYYFTKDQNASDHITVNPSTVAVSGAGPSVTVAQGSAAGLEAALVTEYPGATVTVTALGAVVAQSFTLPVDVPFVAAEIYIRVRKEGNPTDSIRIGLRADSGGNPAGVDLEVATILGSNLGKTMTWVKFTLSNTTVLTYGATYWLLVSRTGSHSDANYYVTELNEDAGYSGELKLWNGSAWVNRAVGADMPFQIWSWRQTTSQIADILTSAGQLFAGHEVRNASGASKRQFRDQDQSGQAEIEALLKVGSSTGRLLARVSPERIAQIYTEPTADAYGDLMLNETGKLTDNAGQAIEPGRLPVGQWVGLTGVPANVDEFERISPLFVERAEWDCEQEQFSALEFKGADNPWETVRIL